MKNRSLTEQGLNVIDLFQDHTFVNKYLEMGICTLIAKRGGGGGGGNN